MYRKMDKGFTIVELLTVMGIIVVLISLLLPALSMVRDFSRDIQQRAQFHSIEVGIGLYEHDFGSPPPSTDNVDMFGNQWDLPDYDGASSTENYCGAMKLAEAMGGMDLLGFHPNSGYYADGINRVRYPDSATGNLVTSNEDIYTADNALANPNWQTGTQNLDARKGPYVDLENPYAFRIADIYGTNEGFVGPSYLPEGTDGPLVLTDVFSKRRRSGEKTGSPILYFRARTIFSQQDSSDWESNATSSRYLNEHQDDIFYLGDNYALLERDVPGDTGTQHPIMDGGQQSAIEEFERTILNDKVSSIKRPYRESSYILWSAGKDGLFGTADDIFNFDKIKD